MSCLQPQLPQPGLFEIAAVATFGHTDPSTPPRYNTQITATDFAAAEAVHLASIAAASPTCLQAVPGTSVRVVERAEILQRYVLPLIGAVAMREALQDAVFSVDAPDLTAGAVRTAAENAKDMRRSAWAIVYKSLGYEAAAAADIGDPKSVKRVVNEDLARLTKQYGRGKSPDRIAFSQLLKTRYS